MLWAAFIGAAFLAAFVMLAFVRGRRTTEELGCVSSHWIAEHHVDAP
jgi:hypothetical protein